MSGYVQIYEHTCIKSKFINERNVYVLITEEKQHLKSSEIVQNDGKVISILVIGTFIIPINIIKQIAIHEKDKMLSASIENGIITIFGGLHDDINLENITENIIYCDQLGENKSLNINRAQVHIAKTIKNKWTKNNIGKKLILK